MKMQFLLQWYFIGLFITNINALDVNVDTTLTGDQTFNEPVTVAAGATLALQSGSNYVFSGDVDVEGTLNIIGDSTTGLANLQFASTSTVTNNGKIDIENIKSSGPVSDYMIAPANLYNNGDLTMSLINGPATTFGLNFTLAPTSSFINKGTIDFDSVDKAGTTTGFLYFGDMTNSGEIITGGLSGSFDGLMIEVYRNFFKGLVFDHAINGDGKVVSKTNAIIFLDSPTSAGQVFSLDHTMLIINPEVVPSMGPEQFDNIVGSSFVLTNTPEEVRSTLIYNKWDTYTGFSLIKGNTNYTFYGNGCLEVTDIYTGKLLEVPYGLPYYAGGTMMYLDDTSDLNGVCSVITTVTSTTQATTITAPTTVTYNTTISVSGTDTDTIKVIVLVQTPAPLTTISSTTAKSVPALTTTAFTTTITGTDGSDTPAVVVLVDTPASSTTVTVTTAMSVTTDLTTTYSTTITGTDGATTPAVVILVETPLSYTTISSTTAKSVTASITTTLTTTITGTDGSTTPAVVVLVETPVSIAYTTISSTTAKSVTALTTATITTAITGTDGVTTPAVVVLVETPFSIVDTGLTTFHITTAMSVTASTTTTYTSTVTGPDGSPTNGVVVLIKTPISNVVTSSSSKQSQHRYLNSTISEGKPLNGNTPIIVTKPTATPENNVKTSQEITTHGGATQNPPVVVTQHTITTTVVPNGSGSPGNNGNPGNNNQNVVTTTVGTNNQGTLNGNSGNEG
ncbi:hypothetical protein MOUN0_I04632 [Monosporozyma unispora]